MRSKPAAVVFVLSGVVLLFGSTAATASAATVDQAASLQVGLTGFSSIVVLLGLIGLAVGLIRLGRRSRAAKRAARQSEPVVAASSRAASVEEPVRTSA